MSVTKDSKDDTTSSKAHSNMCFSNCTGAAVRNINSYPLNSRSLHWIFHLVANGKQLP